tara:strand:+ start:1676 stop:2290 length:615 start_codon:yes stop_codon:yes gene_type:complete
MTILLNQQTAIKKHNIMKNIPLILIFVATFYSCKAQTIYPLGTQPEQIEGNNYYLKDIQNINDNFVGTWLWESGNSSFELTLQEFEQYSYPNNSTQYWDAIFGKYKYIEDGSIISETDEIFDTTDRPLPRVIAHYKTQNIIWISVSDIVSKEYKVGEIVLNDDGTATMTLQDSIGTSGVRTPNDPPPSTLGFQLPTNITLTKVE